MGYEIFIDSLSAVSTKSKLIINTVNQYSYCMAEKDHQFKTALQASDVLLPDGVGIVGAAKLLKGKSIKKIAGADVHKYLLNQLNEQHGSCFYMGSSEKTLERIKDRISKEYPNIKVATHSPPFKKEFSAKENIEIITTVNGFQPDVLFIGMTAPKQEKWSLIHKDEISVKGPICSIGAVFDFYAGTLPRPSRFWRQLGLEWMCRLIKEPKRMWKRYIYFGVIFCYHLIKKKVKPSVSYELTKS